MSLQRPAPASAPQQPESNGACPVSRPAQTSVDWARPAGLARASALLSPPRHTLVTSGASHRCTQKSGVSKYLGTAAQLMDTPSWPPQASILRAPRDAGEGMGSASLCLALLWASHSSEVISHGPSWHGAAGGCLISGVLDIYPKTSREPLQPQAPRNGGFHVTWQMA